jgi:PII-like signaling protein
MIGSVAMVPREACFIRVYANANETWQGIPLYRAVVEAARRRKLGGASVFPVELGFGTHRQLHDIASEYSSFDIPIVVEIIDTAEQVDSLAGELETMLSEGLVVINSAHVLRYSHATEHDETGSPRSSTDSPRHTRPLSEEEGTVPMKIEGEGQRVTVYIGSADTWHGRNLAVAIVEKCREIGMAGATVSRGVMGFGKHSVVHKAHFLGLSDDLPEKIEIVDRPAEIERLLPVLDEMIGGGLIVVEDVHVIRHSHDPKAAKGRM